MNSHINTWPTLADLGLSIEQALHRIGLRGSWRITSDGEDLVVDWVTRGQRGNPFAPSIVARGQELVALVAEVLAKTEPERGGLDWTVPWCLRERRRAEESRRRLLDRMARRREEEARRYRVREVAPSPSAASLPPTEP
jgi:hypothetical protein